MNRDDFVIMVYCLVCEHYQALKALYRLRHGGFAPALSDEEVITMEIYGEFFTCPTDKGFIDAFRQTLLAERHSVVVITPPRKSMATATKPTSADDVQTPSQVCRDRGIAFDGTLCRHADSCP